MTTPRSASGCLLALMLACAPSAMAGQGSWDLNFSAIVTTTATQTEQTLRETPVLTEVIGEGEIAMSGAENLADLLDDHPGVFIARSFNGSTLQMQGLPDKHTLVLVDGRRIAGRKDGALDLSRIPLQGVEQVEIVKGASSALYGSDAIGGVVNIISKRADRGWFAEFEASYGEQNAGFAGASFSHGGERFDLSADFSYQSRDAYDLNDESVATSGSAFDDGLFSLNGTWRASALNTVTAHLEYGYRELAGIDANAAGAVFDRLNNEETFGGGIGLETRFSNSLILKNAVDFSAFESRFLLDQRGSAAQDSAEVTTENLGEASSTLQWYQGRNILSAGLEGLYEAIETGRIDEGSADRTRIAPFIQYEWNIDGQGRWTLLPGFRLDADSQFGTHASPKVSLKYAPTQRIIFRGGVGQGFRSPSFQELYLVFENPSAGYIVEGDANLDPETSLSFNASVDWIATDRFEVTANLYRNDVDDFILYALRAENVPGIGDRFAATNIAQVHTQGIETSLRFRLSAEFQAKLGYVYVDAWNVQDARQLEGRSEHTGTLSVQYFAKALGLRASVRGSYVGVAPYYPTPDVVVDEDAYLALDVRLEQQTLPWLSLFVGADNLTDAGNGNFLNLPPRSIYGGLRTTFQSVKKD